MDFVIVFPNSLFEYNELIGKKTNLFLIEHPVYFSIYAYHKLKLILHRSTMKSYSHYIKKRYHCTVSYEDHSLNALQHVMRKLKRKVVHCYDPCDHIVMKELKSLSRTYKIKLIIHDTPLFLNTRDEYLNYARTVKKLRHDTFYRYQRRKHNILMNNDKPIGGKWSYDTQNRKSFPSGFNKGYRVRANNNNHVVEAQRYVNRHFKDNPGEVKFYLPTDHAGAKRHYDKFLKKRFKCFGPYQDAVDEEIDFGCHSVISALMNIGLLTPMYVITRAQEYGKKYKVPIQSQEGFIRQVLGWREYVYMFYLINRTKFENQNHFKHTRKLKPIWYKSTQDKKLTTGFLIIDNMIDKVHKIGYLHHIERLMYIGNWMLLNKIHPKEVFKWFMVFSMDSYNWVMYANVYGMSQYSVGDLMMTRPYFSSSSYITRMSNFNKKKGVDMIIIDGQEYDWFEVWDYLYYNFIANNRQEFKKNYAISIQVKHWDNKTRKDQREIKLLAEQYMRKY